MRSTPLRRLPDLLMPFVLGAPLFGQGTDDEATRTPSDFVQFVNVGDGGHLDTAITAYEKDGVKLWLFGAVHIADAACYATLNDRFTECDALLYELVAPEDTRPTKDRDEGFNPLGMVQRGMKNALELAFQLDEIDYQATNFVHADMTPEEFAESMRERGESLLSILLDMMMAGMQPPSGDGEDTDEDERERAPAAPSFDLVKAFRSGEGRHTMRMMAAQQMEQAEVLMARAGGGTLLEGRNEKCLQVLARELAKGRKRLGIYYGAAHLPHMEKRLVEDLGWKKVGHEWLVAWDCKKRPDVKFDRALYQLRTRCREELRAVGKAAKAWRSEHGRGQLPTVVELAAPRDGEAPFYAGPRQDPWGHDYVVRKRPVGTRWEVVSGGQDGVLGTDDDLVLVEERSGGMNPR